MIGNPSISSCASTTIVKTTMVRITTRTMICNEYHLILKHIIATGLPINKILAILVNYRLIPSFHATIPSDYPDPVLLTTQSYWTIIPLSSLASIQTLELLLLEPLLFPQTLAGELFIIPILMISGMLFRVQKDKLWECHLFLLFMRAMKMLEPFRFIFTSSVPFLHSRSQ